MGVLRNVGEGSYAGAEWLTIAFLAAVCCTVLGIKLKWFRARLDLDKFGAEVSQVQPRTAVYRPYGIEVYNPSYRESDGVPPFSTQQEVTYSFKPIDTENSLSDNIRPNVIKPLKINEPSTSGIQTVKPTVIINNIKPVDNQNIPLNDASEKNYMGKIEKGKTTKDKNKVNGKIVKKKSSDAKAHTEKKKKLDGKKKAEKSNVGEKKKKVKVAVEADADASKKLDPKEKKALDAQSKKEAAERAKAEKEEKAQQAKRDKEEKAQQAKREKEEKAEQAKREKEEKAERLRMEKDQKALFAKEEKERKEYESKLKKENAKQAKGGKKTQSQPVASVTIDKEAVDHTSKTDHQSSQDKSTGNPLASRKSNDAPEPEADFSEAWNMVAQHRQNLQKNAKTEPTSGNLREMANQQRNITVKEPKTQLFVPNRKNAPKKIIPKEESDNSDEYDV